MGLTKRVFLLLALGILISTQGVYAISIDGTPWTLTGIGAGTTQMGYFNLTLSAGESCTISKTGTAASWLNFPINTAFQNSGNDTIKLTNYVITASVPSIEPSETVTGTLSFICSCSGCSKDIQLSFSVIGSTANQCSLIVTILGGKERGKSISFDIRDSFYNAKDAIVYITRADGTTEKLDCTGGFCSWTIPPVEPGPIITRFIVANCSPLTRQIDLTGSLQGNKTNETDVSGGLITIAGPAEANIGDTYQFLVIGQSQPLKLADISIVGPSGYTFSGTTNQYGIVVDSTNKVYGTEVKPDRTGAYTLFVSREGFVPKTFGFNLIKKDCPYECCSAGDYVIKECNANNNCVSNKCVPIEKPAMKLQCSPLQPNQFEEIKCQATQPSGALITGNTQGSLKKGNNIEESIIFSDGVYKLSQGFDAPGDFQITIPDTVDYKGASYSSSVLAPAVPWLTVGIAAVVIILALVVIILLLRRRKGRGGDGGYSLESKSGVEIEKTSYEKG